MIHLYVIAGLFFVSLQSICEGSALNSTHKMFVIDCIIPSPSNSTTCPYEWMSNNAVFSQNEFRLEANASCTLLIDNCTSTDMPNCVITNGTKISSSYFVNFSRNYTATEKVPLVLQANIYERTTWKLERTCPHPPEHILNCLLIDSYDGGYIQGGVYCSRTDNETFTLTKLNVTMDDAREYVLIAYEKSEVLVNRTVQIKVRSKPDVSLKKPGTSKIIGLVKGLGADQMSDDAINKSIIWEFIPCASSKLKFCDGNNSIALNKTKLHISRRFDLVRTSVFYHANTTGFFKLTARNSLGEDSKRERVCFTQDQRPIWNATNLEKDKNVSMTCAISTCDISTEGIEWTYAANSHSPNQSLSRAVVTPGKETLESTIHVLNAKPGLYTCKAFRNNHGCMGSSVNCKEQSQFDINVFEISEPKEEHWSQYYIIALSAAVILLLLLLFCGFVYLRRRHKKRISKHECCGQATYNSIGRQQILNIDASGLDIDSKWVFPMDKLKLGTVLGTGNFGVVMAAEACGIIEGEETTHVAVKMPRRVSSNSQDFLAEELRILSKLERHIHIVNLLGAVVENDRIMIIFELCSHGNLQNFLQENRPAGRHSEYVQVKPAGSSGGKFTLSWSYQIARGMDWLASKRIVHGDLATRNVLLSTGHIVKISDFGLAASIGSSYVRRDMERLRMPFKWMAIEAIRDGKFSTQSDVWSFGVTMWEIFSWGAVPYIEFGCFQEMWPNVEQGYRLDKPRNCPAAVYRIMCSCWMEEPSERPNFGKLAKQLYQLMDGETQEDYQTQMQKFLGSGKPVYGRNCAESDNYQDIIAEQQALPKPYGFIELLEVEDSTR